MTTYRFENMKVEKITAPYGSWKSPITPGVFSGASKILGGTAVDSLRRLLWLESRPGDSGRKVVVREPEGAGDEPVDITPKEYAVQTMAQGSETGGAFSVSRDTDTLVFSNYNDQRLYKQSTTDSSPAPIPLTPDYGGPVVSYADGVFDSRFNRYVTLREDARQSASEPITTIVAVELPGMDIMEPKVLVSGNDFYAFPRLDSKGERMAWIEWPHPNMPWNRAQLWVGYISEKGEVYKRVCVAGCDPKIIESLTEPKWSPKGELFFISDREHGYWNLHKWVGSNNEVICLYPWLAEFSRPLWNFRMNSYEFTQGHEQNMLIPCSYRQNGRLYLGILDDFESSITVLHIPFTDIDNITLGINCLFVEGASEVLPLSVAKVTLDDDKSEAVEFKIIWSSSPDC